MNELHSIFETEAASSLAFVGVMLILYIILFAIAIVAYLFTAFGHMGMAKKLGLNNPWLAFIPIANIYQLGKIAEFAPSNRPRKYGKKLLILYIAMFACLLLFFLIFVSTMVSSVVDFEDIISPSQSAMILLALLFYFAALVLAVIFAVYEYIAMYKMFKIFSPDNAIIFLLLCLFISYAYPIIVFVLRNNEPKLPADGDTPILPPTDAA